MAKREPVAEQWYPLKLGQTCVDDAASSRFFSFRYEFKPASIDYARRGALHSTPDNKVTVEFFNNQPGKPKLMFDGNVGDYQEADAVLLFDGQSLRLERLHRAVKSLRLVRMPGESSAATAAAAAVAQPPKEADGDSPRDGNNAERISSAEVAEKTVKKSAAATPVARSEKLDNGAPLVPTGATAAAAKPDPAGKKGAKKTPAGSKPAKKRKASPASAAETKPAKGKKAAPPTPPPAPASPPVSPPKDLKTEPLPATVDVEDEQQASPENKVATATEEEQGEEVVEEVEVIEEEESDYECVSVDMSDEDGDKTGVDQTAAILRAQAGAGLLEGKPSSSSSSSESGSGSGSSESGSGSGSSDSGSDEEEEEEEAASSADDGADILDC